MTAPSPTIREHLHEQIAIVEAVGWTAHEDPNGIISRLHSALLAEGQIRYLNGIKDEDCVFVIPLEPNV